MYESEIWSLASHAQKGDLTCYYRVRFGVVFNGRSAPFETLVPLVTLRTAQTVLSISLLQHLKSHRKSFSPV